MKTASRIHLPAIHPAVAVVWLVACGCAAALLANPAHALDNNQTMEGQCGQKTGGGTEGASFWANWAFESCKAMGGDYVLGAAEYLGKVYDDEYGDVTFYKNPKNQKEYYVQKKSGQHRLGLGAQFIVVPTPPAGKFFLPPSLPNGQPGPVLTFAQLQNKQKQAAAANPPAAGKPAVSKPPAGNAPAKKKCPPGKPNADCDMT